MINGSILNLKLFRFSLICAFFLLAGAFPKSAFSQQGTPESKEKKFEPKDVILEHIGDSHSWPVIGKTTLPLPVILYTDKGLEVFSSANIKEEEAGGEQKGKIYQGAYYAYRVEGNKIKVVDASGATDEAASKKVWDFSITRNVVSMFLTLAILFIVFLSVSAAYKKTRGQSAKRTAVFY